jgi:serine/threonine protein kinase
MARVHRTQWLVTQDRGAYGEVFRVTDKASGRVFAIKKIDKFRVKQCNMATQICNEIRIMYEIKHKNIIRIFDHFES